MMLLDFGMDEMSYPRTVAITALDTPLYQAGEASA
jgi:hypothetical protein